MNTRTPSKGQSAPPIPEPHDTNTIAEGHSVFPNNLAERLPAQRLTSADVLMLQRSIGNHAVQRLLQQGQRPHPSPTLSQSPAISHAPSAPLIQAKVDINNAEHTEEGDPATKWGLTAEQVNLYKDLVTSGETMRF